MASVFEIIFKSTGLESVTGGIRNKVVQLGLLVGAWKVAKEAFGEYLDKQSALAELDSALDKAGQATEEYRDKLKDLAGEMEVTAGISDSALLKSLGTLTRMGMRPDEVDGYAEALKNLSALMGGNVEQAAMMLGRAMNGNFETFGKMGFQAKSTEELFRQLAERGGGLAEARMKTLEGQAQNVANALQDLGESAATAGAELTARLTGAKAGEWVEAFAMTLRDVGRGLEVAATKTADFFTGTKSKADEARPALARTTEEIQKAAQAARDAANAEKEWAGSIDEVVDALDRRARREAAMADASLALDLANIDAAEASGTTTPEQAAADRAAAQRKAAAAALDREERDNKFRQEELARQMARSTDPEERAKFQGQRIDLQDQAAAFPLRRQTLDAQRKAAEARLSGAERERFQRGAQQAGRESDAAMSTAEDLLAKVKVAGPEQKLVSEDEAIRAIEKAIGQTLTNQEIRYKRMTGEIERMTKQIANSRT